MASIKIIETGKFKLDGGAMFGVVPHSLWKKLNPPDENNMCTWAMRCLLVEDGDRKILIDAGIGHKQDEKFKGHFYLDNIIEFEHSEIIKTEEITDVILTHLHFDHCGGVLRKNKAGEIEPVFPNAKIWSNDKHYNWAINPNERERASFLKENILPLQELGLLNLIDVENGIRFSDNITIDFVYGHTEAMMIPHITLDNGEMVIFCADLLPSSCHVGLPYVMAYDIRPLETLKEKAALLEKACDPNIKLFLEHDKDHSMIQIGKNDVGRYVAKIEN